MKKNKNVVQSVNRLLDEVSEEVKLVKYIDKKDKYINDKNAELLVADILDKIIQKGLLDEEVMDDDTESARWKSFFEDVVLDIQQKFSVSTKDSISCTKEKIQAMTVIILLSANIYGLLDKEYRFIGGENKGSNVFPLLNKISMGVYK